MALTKTDLDQIRKVVREEVEVEVKTVKHSVTLDLMHAGSDIRALKDHSKNTEILARSIEKKMATLSTKAEHIDSRLDSIENSQEDMGKLLKKIDRKHDKLFHFLDRDWSALQRRVKRVEHRMGLPPINEKTS